MLQIFRFEIAQHGAATDTIPRLIGSWILDSRTLNLSVGQRNRYHAVQSNQFAWPRNGKACRDVHPWLQVTLPASCAKYSPRQEQNDWAKLRCLIMRAISCHGSPLGIPLFFPLLFPA